MHKVLITGITGFLGSHIAEHLVQEDNIEVIGLRRQHSDSWRCDNFKHKIRWISIEQEMEWEKEIKVLAPQTIIHCAWIGVEAKDRAFWAVQKENLDFFITLLDVCNSIKLSQFVFLGSQAEYGTFSGCIKETFPLDPSTPYSYAKLSCLQILETFSRRYNFKWIWLRVFSVFGEREGVNWLLPSLIRRMTNEFEMDLTPADQQYAYLYVKDFARIVSNVIQKKVDSGIYNLSSNFVLSIKELVLKIRNRVNPGFQLNFGNIPYREGQSMYMEGNIEKLESQIGPIEFSDFDSVLEDTIRYYIK